MKRIVLWTFLLMALVFQNLMAGTTGKIAGKITDKSTGEALIGVNVFLDGTVFGATTDVDGNFIILNIPPGKYTLLAQYLGYHDIRLENVRISIDLTTKLDLQMAEAALELGEVIEVDASREMVQKDITSSQASVSAEDIEALPVAEMTDVLQLQAGVTRDAGGGFHIRGGRSNEIAYWVNGVSITDVFDNSQGIEVDNSSVQELQVISGTFNAEYGNAMSGIINTVTKEGGNEFHGSFQAYSGDHLSNFTEYFTAIDRFNPLTDYNLRASLSGPVPFTGKKVKFFVNGRYNYNDGYLYGLRKFSTTGDTLDGAVTAMNWRKKYTGQAKLTYWPANTVKVNAELLYSKQDYQDYDHSYKWEPDGNLFKFSTSYNSWLQLTHTVSSQTFYTVNLAYFDKNFHEYLYKNPYDPRYVYSDTLQPIAYAFRTAGTNNHRFERNTKTLSLKFDFTTQLTQNHLVKLGMEGRSHRLTLDDYSLTARRENGQIVSPYQPEIPADTSAIRTKYDREPVEFSAYIQDKIEYNDMIINIGLRFDYFDSRGQVLVDPSDPNIYNPLRPGLVGLSYAEREPYFYKDAKPKYQLSPRLGLAYPISSQGVIHFSYGHFLQIPSFVYLYNAGGYKVPETGQFYGPYGNPDLEAQKTVMYELGLQQEIFTDFKIDVTGFYRDVRDWITSGPMIPTRNGVSYSKYINKDYANVKGITLVLKKRYSNHYSFDVSYTYQVAEGSNSSPEEEFYSQRSNNEPTLYLLPLDWDQRHLLNASFYVGTDTWGSSLLARLGSGLPYTPSITQYTADRGITWGLQKNSRRRPYQFTLDLKLHKNWRLAGFHFITFLRVFNLLDSKNAVNVFGDTGKPNFTTEHVPDDLTQRPNTVAEYRRFPWNYGEPRRVQFGLEWTF